MDREITLMHQARNWATVILGNIEMGNLEKALAGVQRLKEQVGLHHQVAAPKHREKLRQNLGKEFDPTVAKMRVSRG